MGVLHLCPKLKRPMDTKVYIEHLFVGRLIITISFLPAVWNNLQQNTTTAQATHIGKNLNLLEESIEHLPLHALTFS